MTTIAVMQPYFFPYLGYFRLMAAADVFVIYDCVQFPRRGWVHRNRIDRGDGTLEWLTLPVAKADRDALIREIEFADGATDEMRERISRFAKLDQYLQADDPFVSAAANCARSPLEMLTETLTMTRDHLALGTEMISSSSLDIPADLRAQDRILAIVEALAGSAYVNAPGGRSLYDADTFASRGVELRILTPYDGNPASMLSRLPAEPAADLQHELAATTSFDSP